MIWFAGILQNTCCNNSKKIQQKKHWVVSVMSFNYAHWVSHQCVRYENTQKKTHKPNTFSFRCVGNQHFHRFWTPPPLFSWVNGRTFFGRALSRSQMGFFDLCPVRNAFWMRSWRNAWRCLFGRRTWSAEGRAEKF